MARWKYEIDISTEMKAEDPVRAARSAACQCRALGIDDEDLTDICLEFDDVAESGGTQEFDSVLEQLYDWADVNRLWVHTRSES